MVEGAVQEVRAVGDEQGAASRAQDMVGRMKTITGLAELKASEGEVLGTSDWHEVTQEAIDQFADVTGDHQWIHVDVERRRTRVGGRSPTSHGRRWPRCSPSR